MTEFRPDVLLIDISAIAHAVWHTSDAVSNRDQVSATIASRVHTLSNGFVHVAVCCDEGRSFRYDLDPNYKANRPDKDEGFSFQLKKAIQRLKDDGFAIWSVKGFEADDLIASAVKALRARDLKVLVASSDKDLFQLVEDGQVMLKSLRDGSFVGPAFVQEKLGVRPDQVRDVLTLIGDQSDNVPGAKGIGPVKAAKLLTEFGTLDALYEKMASTEAEDLGLKPAMAASLEAFREQMPKTRALIELRYDVPLPIEDLLTTERRASASVVDTDDDFDTDEMAETPEMTETTTPAGPAPETGTAMVPATAQAAPEPAQSALATREAVQQANGSLVAFERQLEPTNRQEAFVLSKHLNASGLYLRKFANEHAILATALVGRELGLSFMAAVRGIHIIEGTPTLAANLMVGMVLDSGKAEYWEVEESTDKVCTVVTKRKGSRKEERVTHTIEMAERAGLLKPNGNWFKTPEDMLLARASSRLARRVYADVVFGLYAPEEITENI